MAIVTPIQHEPTNHLRQIHYGDFGNRYPRSYPFYRLTGSSATLHWTVLKAAGGAGLSFLDETYTLYVNGVAAATATPVDNRGVVRSRVTFTLDLTAYADHTWLRMQVKSPNETAPSPSTFFFLNKNSTVVENPPPMPIATNRYDTDGQKTDYYTEHQWAFVDPEFNPVVVPLKPRAFVPFSTVKSGTQIYRRDLVIHRPDNQRRPNRTSKNEWSAFDMQAYRFADVAPGPSHPSPRLPLLDGPRGIGSCQMLTHVHITRHGGAICADAWRIMRVLPTGEVETRAGWRCKNNTPRYWGELQDVELVGDWSAIPPERHGFREIWDCAWDERTLTLDTDAAKIGPPANPTGFEFPHHGPGPVFFVADTQHNRIIKLQFNATDHEPPKVYEFITGLQDPWGLVCVGDSLYVGERLGHRISEYSADDGTLRRVVLQGEALATVTASRWVKLLATREVIRQQPIVAPEGMAYQDGWLYFGSAAMKQVRRYHLETGTLEVFANDVPADIGSSVGSSGDTFIKIAISDGTFGPRGSVFCWTWITNTPRGLPSVYLPGGGRWYLAPNTVGEVKERAITGMCHSNQNGWVDPDYTSAGAVGKGVLYNSSSLEGLHQYSLKKADDIPVDRAKHRAGWEKYQANYELTHGRAGYGYYNLELPWGVDPDIDYYLTVCGHRQDKAYVETAAEKLARLKQDVLNLLAVTTPVTSGTYPDPNTSAVPSTDTGKIAWIKTALHAIVDTPRDAETPAQSAARMTYGLQIIRDRVT